VTQGLRSAISFVLTAAVTSGCALFLVQQGLGWTVFAALLGALVYSVLSLSLAAEDEAEPDRRADAERRGLSRGGRRGGRSVPGPWHRGGGAVRYRDRDRSATG
jgi:hypothetical protein